MISPGTFLGNLQSLKAQFSSIGRKKIEFLCACLWKFRFLFFFKNSDFMWSQRSYLLILKIQVASIDWKKFWFLCDCTSIWKVRWKSVHVPKNDNFNATLGCKNSDLKKLLNFRHWKKTRVSSIDGKKMKFSSDRVGKLLPCFQFSSHVSVFVFLSLI